MGENQTTSSFSVVLQYLLSIFGNALLPLAIPWAIYLVVKSRSFKSLEGKVVLITGASSGIGEALAHEFYACGCKLILAARRTKELERVRDELCSSKNANNCRPAVLTLDLGNIDSLAEQATVAESIFGRVDILVNNAGVAHRGRVIDTTMAVYSKIMDVNYFGQIALVKGLLGGMISRKSGHIVTISSVQGKISLPSRSAYGASKHALDAFMDSLRAEVADSGVQVTVISPGYVRTEFSSNAITGSGAQYGVTDENTRTGLPPSVVAAQTVRAVRYSQPELIVAPITPKLAVYLRTFLPTLYFFIMKLRARKELQSNSTQ